MLNNNDNYNDNDNNNNNTQRTGAIHRRSHPPWPGWPGGPPAAEICPNFQHTCHILPPSEIDLGLCLAVFAGSGGKYLFHRIGWKGRIWQLWKIQYTRIQYTIIQYAIIQYSIIQFAWTKIPRYNSQRYVRNFNML